MELLVTISNPKIPLGTSPLLDLAVRNTSAKPAHFRYFRPTLCYPVLKDSKGHSYSAVFPPYDGPAQPVDLDLKPGETRNIESTSCLFTQKPRGQIYLQIPPGKYQLTCSLENLTSKPINILVIPK